MRNYYYKPSRRTASAFSYNDLLKSQLWKDKRAKILQKSKNRCAFCGDTENLEVHHKYYSKYPNGVKVSPWNYPDEALIVLCKYCHKKVHKRYKIKTYYRKYTDNYE